jgi:Peptidase family C54
MEYVHRVSDWIYNILPFRMPPEGLYMLGQYYSELDEEQFVIDFGRFISITYGKDFESLLDSSCTSDSGWGCSIRVAQMLIAELLRYRGAHSKEEICAYFADTPMAPLSIHKFVAVGKKKFNKNIKDWYGPTSSAVVMQDLLDDLKTVKCVTFHDVIYRSEVIQAFQASPTTIQRLKYEESFPINHVEESLTSETPDVDETVSVEACKITADTIPYSPPPPKASGLCIQLSRKLGVDHFNVQRYKEPLFALFKVRHFRGLASGESTTSALYVIGASEESVFFLDPHLKVQSVGDRKYEQERILRMPWERLNASMTFGFYVETVEMFNDLVKTLESIDNELFEILEKRIDYANLQNFEDPLDSEEDAGIRSSDEEL